MGNGIHTLHDFMLHTEGITYIMIIGPVRVHHFLAFFE